MNEQKIGDRIRQARKNCKLTQAQLADKAFISESYMALIELNQRNPSTDVVTRLSEILNVSADHLIFGNAEISQCTLYNQWKQLTNGRSDSEIQSAYKLVETFFNCLDNEK